MKNLATTSIVLFVLAISLGQLAAQESPTPAPDQPEAKADSTKPDSVKADPAPAAPGATTAAVAAPPTPPPYAAFLKDAKSYSGLLDLHQSGNRLFAELNPGSYGAEYMILISIARGIGQDPLLGGYSWGFGDDWVWTFRKIDDQVHVIRKNVRFRANKGFPEEQAVRNAYTDSVLFSLKVLTKGPKGGDLIDLTPIFMSDLPQIGQALPGFGFASDRSTWGAIKPFPRNMEIEVEATYSSGGRAELETVADSRGVTVHVHYSISRLESTGYQPRLADDRVGYFLTVVKDYNKASERDQFVRYINRWNLQKAPGAENAPFQPKEPIIFYIERTVPHAYRSVIREGIAEWNKAFEKAGWVNAIEVRQQLDDDTFDPEDVRFNTFRWITASAGFAMGPSRVNPYTGEILDADIIFDADFLQFWKEEYETLTPQAMLQMTGGWYPREGATRVDPAFGLGVKSPECALSTGMASQLAFGASAILAFADPQQSAQLKEKLVRQGLKEVTMHEVGHTLGLRHNFKASRMLSLKDLNDPAKANGTLVASVMDYSPTNIVPKEWQQGDYYATTLGPYDYWAIDYGYKPLSGGTGGEVKELAAIAARSGEPGLQYATDEDTVDADPDPGANRFDLGSDPVEYAKARSQIVKEVMPTLLTRVAKDGEDYALTRRAFGMLLAQHGQSMYFAARFVGGLNTNRSHKGDKDAAPPVTLVDPAKQREVLTLLEEQVFSDAPFQFPPELYNYLAKSNWQHWGVSSRGRKDYPIHEAISQWQLRILDQMLSSTTLSRIRDSELKAAPDADVLTAAELIGRLSKAIFVELDTIKEGDFTDRKPAISSLRRSLQREFVRRLSNMALARRWQPEYLMSDFGSAPFLSSVPEDCQTLAHAELQSLQARMDQLLKSNAKLDAYSRAHMQESSARIAKVLDARFTFSAP